MKPKYRYVFHGKHKRIVTVMSTSDEQAYWCAINELDRRERRAGRNPFDVGMYDLKQHSKVEIGE